MDWSELLDQILHITWGYGVVIVFWLGSGRRKVGPMALLGGALAALLVALPRELVDQWPIERPWDSVLDTLSFVIGGQLAGMTAWLAYEDSH